MRRLPIVERERLLGGEIQTVLAALGPEPESIFPAVVVERGTGLPGFDEGAVDEAQALTACLHGAGHHRAWYWLETAIRPPPAPVSIFRAPCWDKNATSASKECAVAGGAGWFMVEAGTEAGGAAG